MRKEFLIAVLIGATHTVRAQQDSTIQLESLTEVVVSSQRKSTALLQVPYLVDPNMNVAMYESADIQRYLQATYGA